MPLTPNNRLQEIRPYLKPLTEKRLAEAERTDLTSMHFTQPIAQLRVIKRLCEAFAQERVDELPPNITAAVLNISRDLEPLVQAMIDFDVEHQNAGQLRQKILGQVEGHYNQMVGNYRQHIRGQVDSASAVERIEQAEAAASALISSIEQIGERSEHLVARAETLSADLAAGSLSSYYDGQAKRHRDASRAFIIGAGLSALAVAILATVLFLTIDERPASEWTGYVRDLGVRVFVLGLGLYVVGFMVKGYRANQHLLVVNEHKANALKTFRLFQDAVSDDSTTRDLITAELVKAVFAADETGFLENAPDRTVVEGQAGLIALLAQQKKSA
jgi:hypothetical protein